MTTDIVRGLSKGKGHPPTKRRLREIYGDDCYLCGKTMDFTPVDGGRKRSASIDHVLPKYMGGTDEFSNLRLACRACNTFRQYIERWVLKRCRQVGGRQKR